MKRAKDMFEKLGFIEDDDNHFYIKEYDYGSHTMICFFPSKSYEIRHFVLDSYTAGTYPVDMELNKAIQKKLEELGWDNE